MAYGRTPCCPRRAVVSTVHVQQRGWLQVKLRAVHVQLQLVAVQGPGRAANCHMGCPER